VLAGAGIEHDADSVRVCIDKFLIDVGFVNLFQLTHGVHFPMFRLFCSISPNPPNGLTARQFRSSVE
jgi:hypothetical protein